MNCENSARIYIIETKIVSQFITTRAMRKKKGQKMGLNCPKLLKTNIEKMSAFRLSMMLMKIKKLYGSFHDVYEKKGSY